MPFPYYSRLSAAERRIYRQSDRVSEVTLEALERLQRCTAGLEAALRTEEPPRVRRAATTLCNALFDDLDVPRVVVKVRSRRPSDSYGELHGLYTWEEGKPAQIEVWMRTAAEQRVVAFRTFLRTLLHEVCHHLDFALLGLAETFHTEGFFRRESSLFRQLVPRRTRVEAEPGRVAKRAPRLTEKPKKRRKAQLSLFDDGS